MARMLARKYLRGAERLNLKYDCLPFSKDVKRGGEREMVEGNNIKADQGTRLCSSLYTHFDLLIQWASRQKYLY